MKIDNLTEDVQFVVMPYIRLKQETKFSDYTLWPDADSNWEKYLGIERPSSILEIYKDHQGLIMDSLTVVTYPKSVSTLIPMMIGALYFAYDMNQFSHTNAESFYYDMYNLKKPLQITDHHSRVNKFNLNVVLSSKHNMYPSEYSQPIIYELRHPSLYQQLSDIFGKTEYNNVFYGLSFYIRTQNCNPSIFPTLEDLQNFCTSFEILFSVEDEQNLGETVGQKLYDLFNKDREEERKALKIWCIEMYRVRGKYTHGHPIANSLLVYNNQRHIDIAKKIYIDSVLKTLSPSDKRHFVGAANLLTLFGLKELYEDIVKKLTFGYNKSKSATKSLKAVEDLSDDALYELYDEMQRFSLYFDESAIGEVNEKRLRQAIQTLLFMIECVKIEYSKKGKDKQFYTEPLKTLDTFNFMVNTEKELEKAVVGLRNSSMIWSQPINNIDEINDLNYRHEVTYGDFINIPTIIRAIGDLYHVSLNQIRYKK